MVDSVFNLPLVVTGPAIIISLCLFGIGGLLLARRCVLVRLRIRVEDSEFSGAMMQCVMVFYGLAVALIAMTVFQTYSDVSKVVSSEAGELNAIYRDVSSYPDQSGWICSGNFGSTEYVIHDAWPLQRRGKVLPAASST